MPRLLVDLKPSLFCLTAAAILGSCGGSTEPRRPATVTVSGPSTIGSLGSTVQLTATVADGSGATMSGLAVQWSTSNGAVGSVDPATGVVTAIGPGTATLRATVDGVVGTHDITVAQIAASMTLVPPTDTMRALTATAMYSAIVKDTGGAVIGAPGVNWSSTNPLVASITGEGTATAVANGAVFVRAQVGSLLDSVPLAVRQRVSYVQSTVTLSRALLFVGDTIDVSLQTRDSLNKTLTFGGAAVTFSTASAGGGSSGAFLPTVDQGDGTYTSRFAGSGVGSPVVVTSMIAGLPVSASASARVVGFTKISGYSAGFPHTCGIITTGDLYCWGDQTTGMRGIGSNVATVTDPTPTLVSGGRQWSDVSAGFWSVCGISNTTLYCWGNASEGQLGNGFNNGTFPSPVAIAPESSFVAVNIGLAAGECAITVAHSAMCWGRGIEGRVGNGADTTVVRAVGVNGGNKFAALATSAFGTCGVSEAGAAICWGFYATLGIGYGPYPDDCGGQGCSKSPVAVLGGLTFRPVIIHDGNTACSIATDDKTYCWGQTVQEVPGAPVFTALAAGDLDYCGLAQSGTVYCWGTNRNGRFGNPPDPNMYQSTPVAVPGSQHFTQISMSQNHMCGITTDGNAWCWGSNANGELGDRTTTPSTTPVRVRLFVP
jgi:alpha-tubulin suppressor-like RCC1 family protein